LKTVEITTASGSLADYTRKATRTPLILTSRGKPVVAMVDIRGFDREALSLSTNPKFLAILKRSRDRLEREGGIPAEEVRRNLGIPARKATRSPRKPRARKDQVRRRPALNR
jgi:prevent-host-death family protein